MTYPGRCRQLTNKNNFLFGQTSSSKKPEILYDDKDYADPHTQTYSETVLKLIASYAPPIVALNCLSGQGAGSFSFTDELVAQLC
jgi:hypothetical protein